MHAMMSRRPVTSISSCSSDQRRPGQVHRMMFRGPLKSIASCSWDRRRPGQVGGMMSLRALTWTSSSCSEDQYQRGADALESAKGCLSASKTSACAGRSMPRGSLIETRPRSWHFRCGIWGEGYLVPVRAPSWGFLGFELPQGSSVLHDGQRRIQSLLSERQSQLSIPFRRSRKGVDPTPTPWCSQKIRDRLHWGVMTWTRRGCDNPPRASRRRGRAAAACMLGPSAAAECMLARARFGRRCQTCTVLCGPAATRRVGLGAPLGCRCHRCATECALARVRSGRR